MKAHFVTFCSPGTFVSETSQKPVDAWSIDLAVRMAREIHERHNATPYGFFFTTRTREDHELDSKETDKSRFYWLGGEVFTLEQLEEKNDPEQRILRANMKNNGYNKCIVNTNSWRFTSFMKDDDVVLDFKK